MGDQPGARSLGASVTLAELGPLAVAVIAQALGLGAVDPAAGLVFRKPPSPRVSWR